MLSDNRKAILQSALGSSAEEVLGHLDNSGSISNLPSNIAPGRTLEQLKLANSVAHVSNDNVHLAQKLLSNPDVKSLRDVALKYSTERIARLWLEENADAAVPSVSRTAVTTKVDMTVDESSKRASSPPITPTAEAVTSSAQAAGLFQRRLFQLEPTAVLQRMLASNELSIHQSPAVQDRVVKFLDSQPTWNIRQVSVVNLLNTPAVTKGLAHPDDDVQMQDDVVKSLQILQRVQALAPTPEAIPPLIDRGVTSALQVSSIPQKKFVEGLAPALGEIIPGDGITNGEDLARQIHTHAAQSRLRIDDALLQIYQTIKGTGRRD